MGLKLTTFHLEDVKTRNEGLIWMTAQHIETYQYHASLSRTAQAEIQRLRKICEACLELCKQFDVLDANIESLQRDLEWADRGLG